MSEDVIEKEQEKIHHSQQLVNENARPEQTNNNSSSSPLLSLLQHVRSQVKMFPPGTKQLYQDYRTSGYISDVIHTSQHSYYRNGWSSVSAASVVNVDSDSDGDGDGIIKEQDYDGDEHGDGGGPPRWALEFQRQSRRELSVVFPTVLLSALPFGVGFLAPLLSIPFPRQMLSHHFLVSRDEALRLAQEEIKDRQTHDEDVIQSLYNTARGGVFDSGDIRDEKNRLMDDIGPMSLNLEPLLDMFGFGLIRNNDEYEHHHSTDNDTRVESDGTTGNQNIMLCSSSVDTLSRHHLVALILSAGYSKLPGVLAQPLYSNLVPTPLLRRLVRHCGTDLIRDDADLLRESERHRQRKRQQHLENENDGSQEDKPCSRVASSLEKYIDTQLSDDEVQAACVLRGLWPKDHGANGNANNTEEQQSQLQLPPNKLRLQKLLLHHLQIMKHVADHERVRRRGCCWPQHYNEEIPDSLILLSLHLTPMRRQLML
jgi:hypothetical protein